MTTPIPSNGSPSQNEKDRLSRRQLLKSVATATGAGAASVLLPKAASAAPADERYPSTPVSRNDTVTASSTSPVADTQYGKVKGFVRSGIHIFKGIPYADTTADKNRFMPPRLATHGQAFVAPCTLATSVRSRCTAWLQETRRYGFLIGALAT